ncbi:phosphatase PAP2 family protein [Fluviicoccus keumensis]|uniref:phosphatase PAP2 family protein n=1 Tax=Fluviicoccus keumensis TaxID=1435465 RepID=UPI0013EE6804|nr:phosphatase PAP2 family protein [Fluviicoccus keumensis]
MQWHLLLPLVIFAIGALTFQFTHIDLATGDFFFRNGVFTGRDGFWADRVIHKGGGVLVVSVALAGMIALAGSYLIKPLAGWRKSSAYLLLCMAAGTGIVGGLKQVTNIDCPWDLQRYGGEMPYVHIYDDKPDNLERGKCFPGGHSSGAFSLFALYFLTRQHRPAWRKGVLGGILVLGFCWGLGQWARGAHFPSHDFYSAFICWMVCLGAYLGFWKEKAN